MISKPWVSYMYGLLIIVKGKKGLEKIFFYDKHTHVHNHTTLAHAVAFVVYASPGMVQVVFFLVFLLGY